MFREPGREPGMDELNEPLTIGKAERDRLRSILGPGERQRQMPAARRNDLRIDDRSAVEVLRDVDGKLDKLLEGGRAVDDLRTEIAQLHELVTALTQLVVDGFTPPAAAMRVRRRPPTPG